MFVSLQAREDKMSEFLHSILYFIIIMFNILMIVLQSYARYFLT